MVRVARKVSESGIYHVVLRGINRQVLFEDQEDYERFIESLEKCKRSCTCELLAYCLMSNHVHLLIKTAGEPPSEAIKRLAASYVFWYNRKYQRVGHLFQDRYLSEPVDDNAYLLTVLRYIHQNPIKAGLSTSCSYPYSSYDEYIGGASRHIADTGLPLDMIGRGEFIEFHDVMGEDVCLDAIHPFRGMSDRQASEIIRSVVGGVSTTELQTRVGDERTRLIRELRSSGISVRQLSRLTGIGRGILQRV